MARLDERLTRELERAGRPADPTNVYEQLIRRRERRRIARRLQAGAVALVVSVGSLVGIWALVRVFPLDDGSQVAAPPVTNGVIAFERVAEGEGNGSHVWLVESDGTNERQLTFGKGMIDRWPAWSPDGTRVAFVRRDRDSSGLWVIDATGGEPRMITPPRIGAARPDWSPDGGAIVFAGVMGETPESGIHVVNTDGTDLEQITGPEFFAPDNPEWSPDGSWIAFSGNLDDSRFSWDVYVMSPDGSDLRNLTQTPEEQRSEWPIGWLPNGNLLVWQGPGRIASGLGAPLQTERWLEIDDAGEIVRVVYEGPANTAEARQGPSLSPDGRFVVFDTPDEEASTIRFVDLQTAEVTKVTTRGTSPAWQPIPAGSPVPSPPTGASGPTTPTGATGPTTGTEPSGGWVDLGLGFPVCDVTALEGVDMLGNGASGTAWTYAEVRDDGRCPDRWGGRAFLAVDLSGDRLADTWWGPFTSCISCEPLGALDLDADGDDELAVLEQAASTPTFLLFDVVPSEDMPGLRPIPVAEPGSPRAGLDPLRDVGFATGGDEGFQGTVACEGFPEDPVVVIAWSWHPVEGPGSDVREVHIVGLELRADAQMHVVSESHTTIPVDERLPEPFGNGGEACGLDFDPANPTIEP